MDDPNTKTLELVHQGIKLAMVLLEYAKTSKNVKLAKDINNAITLFMKELTQDKTREKAPDKFNKKMGDVFKKTPKDETLDKIYEKSLQKDVDKLHKEGKKNINKILKTFDFKKDYNKLLNLPKPKFIDSLANRFKSLTTINENKAKYTNQDREMLQSLVKEMKHLQTELNLVKETLPKTKLENKEQLQEKTKTNAKEKANKPAKETDKKKDVVPKITKTDKLKEMNKFANRSRR